MKLALLLLLVPATAMARPEPDRSKTYAIPVDGYPSDGPADAKVTLVIAHDYADPYSHRNRTTLEELRKKYGNELRIVFRNMVVHPRNAMAGALASCAAHKQKAFDAMEDKLWEAFQQRQWDQSEVDNGNGPVKCWDVPEGCNIVVGLANTLGLKVDRFKADMRSCVQHVNDDMKELQNFSVQATPSFFINGRYLSGAMPTENFEKVIDEEMAKATEAIKKGTPKARYYKTIVIGKGEKKVDQTAQAPTMPSGGAPPMPPRRPEPDATKNYAIKVDGYPSKGAADAKVTIVMFFDYATPYADKARGTLDDLMKQYGKDLRIVYRTRLVHPANAMASAMALCAAHKVGKAMPMDEALWEKGFKARNFDQTNIDLGNGPQKCWETPDGCKAAVQIAQDLGHDPKKFKADMTSCVKVVQDDDADAGTFQVNATPTFFINGRVLMGAQSAQAFSAIIDDELAKANDRIKGGTPKTKYYKAWILDKGEKSVP
jgi:protein-disulfide isomerase